MKCNKLNIGQIALFIGFTFIAFFYGMSAYPIADMNEGLYAEIGREMLVSHNYIIPHLNFVPYIEKPPLLYWLLLLSYKIFGVSTFAARLIPALSSMTVSFTLLWFAKKLELIKLGWLAGIILASGIGYILISRVVFFDMLLTAAFTLTLCSFFLWHKFEDKKYLWSSYIGAALACLTKGIMPLIFAFLIAISFMVCMRTSTKKIIAFFNPIGIFIFLLLVTPWHIIAALNQADFFQNFVINEQIMRFFNKRIPHDYHTGPLYYYIPRVFVYLFPWTTLLPKTIKVWRGKLSEQNPLQVFLWLWFLIPLLIFSISSAKGDYFMVLSMPALAMILAEKINAKITQKQFNLTLTWFYLLIALSIIGLCFYLQIKVLIPLPSMPQLKVLIIFLISYSVFGLTFILFTKNNLLTFLLTAGLICPLVVGFVNFEVKNQDFYNQKTIVNYIAKHDINRPLYLFYDYEKVSTLLWFTQKRIPIVFSQSQDLLFGSKSVEAEGWFIDDKTFAAIIANQTIYVALLPENLELFKKHIAPAKFCVATKSGKAVLVTNDLQECFLN